MKKGSLLILTLLISYSVWGQNLNTLCKCPASEFAGTKADTVFKLSNGNSIALCGYRDLTLIKGKTLFSEFVLSVCGTNKIIKFWGATDLCDLQVIKDTLFVNTIVSLPVGKNMQDTYVTWLIERIYPKDGRTLRDSTVNKQLPKYTSTQISSVLKLYNDTPNQNSEKTAEIMDKLLIAAISGSAKAKAYLINLPKKFTLLDGAYAEQYDGDIHMLKEWEQQ